MSAFKQFTTKDVTLTPFKANKLFSFSGNEITGSNCQIEFYSGVKPPTGSIFISSSATPTGYTSIQNTVGIYNSAKHLYYSNFLTKSTGDNIQEPILIPGVTSKFDVYLGSIENPRYENYLQTSLSQSRNFPTSSGNHISMISIPSKLYGENIVPSTFELSFTQSGTNYTITDDGEGNLVYNIISPEKFINLTDTSSATFSFLDYIKYPTTIPITSSNSGITFNNGFIIDNLTQTLTNFNILGTESNGDNSDFIFIISGSEGEVGFTSQSILANSPFEINISGNLIPNETYNLYVVCTNVDGVFQTNSVISASFLPPNSPTTVGQIFYSHGNAILTYDPISSASYEFDQSSSYVNLDNIKFSSSLTYYEQQYKCVVRDNELGYTLNPSAISSSDFYYDFVTGSNFEPYVTTIGLYDNNQNLLAVGKLSNPTPLSKDMDTTFIINYDI